jgi:flagellar hook-associated protein 3 FlgL
MIQSLNPSAELFLANVDRIQSQINQAESEVSSGLKISQPSDAPNQLEGLMRIRADIDRNTQVTTNLSEVKAETDTAEQSLSTATQLLDTVTSLGTQGANFTQTASSRQAMALQVQGILEQLVGLSNTTVQGRFVFSGDQDQSPSYDLNLANPNGVDRLLTTQATRQVTDASGVSFTVGLTAQNIFDHRNPDDTLAPDNVFAAVNSLRLALQSNDQAGITTALTGLSTADTYLNSQLSFYGSVQNRIQSAQTFAGQQNVQLQSALSQTQDADVTQAAVTLTQSQTQLQAALSAQAARPRTSLFDFLG